MLFPSLEGYMLKNTKDIKKKFDFFGYSYGSYKICKRNKTFGKVSARFLKLRD